MGESDNSGEVAKWVDPAMFRAEEMPAEALDRPTVHLLWMTPDPLGAAAAMNAMYTGKVRRSLADVTHAERAKLLEDMQRTRIQAPLEAIKMHFLIEGVTRGFTHQLVRQRTAVYAQESTRFAVFGDGTPLPVGLPPSLQGTMSSREWYATYPGRRAVHEDNITAAQQARFQWDATMFDLERVYGKLIDAGMPAEDARGLLPTNLLTRIHYVTDLRNLYGHAGNRLCTQAQFEWRLVFAAMADAIRNYDPLAAVRSSYLHIKERQDAVQTGETRRTLDALAEMGALESWQYEGIADLFRPICYMTGKCEFKATADRKCKIRNRVDANAAVGRPSEIWHTAKYVGEEGNEHIEIDAIQDMEWLADPTAAR